MPEEIKKKADEEEGRNSNGNKSRYKRWNRRKGEEREERISSKKKEDKQM